MSFVSSTTLGNEPAQKFIQMLQTDFKNLSQESKRKYPQIKESCEEAISKLQNAGLNNQTSMYYLINQILYPLVQGCETKDLKIIKFCLGMMQRLITQQVVDPKGARYITDALWMLMENGIEEVKVLQTVTLLLTTNSVVHGETLAKVLVLCFRLHFSKDNTIVNTAGATIRQLVSLVFERVLVEHNNEEKTVNCIIEQRSGSALGIAELKPCAADAFLLFQDLVQLVNADQPFWLLGMTEMTRTFGLELLENILSTFSIVFHENSEFTVLLKERVCALVIKLFSPNIKHRLMPQINVSSGTPYEKPFFPISIRLLRLVSVLIKKHHALLITECEIFLSLIVKFLDPDKPNWQRALALEVMFKMSTQKELLISFCESYDLKDHSTKILQDMINSLGAYVHSFYISNQLSGTGGLAPQATLNTPTSNLPINASSLQQPGFNFKGFWLPLFNFPNGQVKPIYLEMLEKSEPPSIPEGYGISVAYSILLEIVKSILQVVRHGQTVDKSILAENGQKLATQKTQLYVQLINSSWCGLLSAFTSLIDAATDETTTDNILKAIQDYTAVCGKLGLNKARDAFITAVCKASLPPHYVLSVLNTGYQNSSTRVLCRGNNTDINNSLIGSCNENEFRQQVVAVGTPLPTSSLPLGVQQGPVMLTTKNLQCMRALLNIAHNHGSVLGSSWHLVLATLQHLVWILGLKPSTGGSLQATSKPALETTTGIQTSVMADLPVLSQMLSQLFESSQNLDDVALHHLIDALCKLSQEAMELAYTNREPSLFAVAKLLETGLVNLPRVEVLWRPLTNHLLEVCQHRHIRMREWGVEAITYLVKASLQFKYENPLKENLVLQTLLLSPLAELSSVPHGDVRQRQLECVLQILNGAGETLSFGWPSILGIIGAVNDHHGEALIRIAFQCLQLVVTDFLPIMPFRCLPLSINTAAKFGSQTQELNISLTAVGLMWNISDYFNQNQQKLINADAEDDIMLPDFPGTINMPQFDKLWMCLYTRLGELCVDLRPAVRKSAGQTLFSTISAHGNLLNPPTWQAILWQVLFPLLDKVRTLSNSASNEKVDTSGNILIHHSRNTAQKQWAETQVLTLSGVARVFNNKRQLLQKLGDFSGAWSLVLEFIENSALSKSNEVSLAALKSLQEILYNKIDKNINTPDVIESQVNMWNVAWQVWLNIGLEITRNYSDKNSKDRAKEDYIPSQAFLTALVQIFPALFQHIKHRINEEDLNKMCSVLLNAVAIPMHNDVQPYTMLSVADSPLTPLHDGVLDCMELLQKEATEESSHVRKMIPTLFKQLLSFSKFACVPPIFDNSTENQYDIDNLKGNPSIEWISMNYVPFGEKALSVAVKLYQETASEETVIEHNILHEIIKALKIPLSLKYKCLSFSTWKLAISSLILVLQSGLKVARLKPNFFTNIWDDLYEVLDNFLFPSSTCTVEDRGLEEIVLDESFDCQVIELLRKEILPFSNEIPHEFILNIIVLLNKGSIHSATNPAISSEAGWKLREMFAKECFETLLQFSVLDETNNIYYTTATSEHGLAGRLAVTALLHRFQEVLKKFNDDERQCGKCPLPRYRLSEISFVLKAIATLVISMKRTSTKVNQTAWDQLIGLYPYLVDCTTTSSSEVSKSLREALLQYADLLCAPSSIEKMKNGFESHC